MEFVFILLVLCYLILLIGKGYEKVNRLINGDPEKPGTYNYDMRVIKVAESKILLDKMNAEFALRRVEVKRKEEEAELLIRERNAAFELDVELHIQRIKE